ncbi:unnamed protein product [Dicrocoelium dendriticum]|nr:unnamed protein product [Dicrocoelium dendriticum]
MPSEMDQANQAPTHFGQTLGKADFAQRPMSLRKFLEPFDHTILTDYEAGEKYAAYKLSFAKQQLEDFFEKNKNHAWFREKYHPDVKPDPSLQRRLCEHRLRIFMQLYHDGHLSDISLNGSNDATIVKFLDTVAIKLAGGTDEDVRFLDEFKYAKTSSKLVSTNSAVAVRTKEASDANNIPAKSPSTLPVEISDHEGTPKRKPRISAHDPSTERRPKAAKQKSRRQRRQTKKVKDGAEDASSTDRSSSRSGSASSSGSSSGDGAGGDGSSSSSSSSSSSGTDSESASSQHSGSSSDSDSSGSSESEEEVDSSASENKSEVERKVRRRHPNVPDQSTAGKRTKKTSQNVRRTHRNSSSSSGASSARSSISPNQSSSTRLRRGPVSNLEDEMKPSRNPKVHADPTDSIQTKQSSGNVMTVEQEFVLEEDPELQQVRKLPFHHTRVLYFPHIPFTVYQKDLIALFSTSPHFLRLAVLDPVIMPSTDGHAGHVNEPFFGPDTDSSPGISLRRVGWATFAAQTKEGDNLVNVDVKAICSKLLHQATEAQAPEDLLECLRTAKALPDHLKRLNSHRVRSSSYFMTKLLETCPERLYSKGLLRRHLVLAAKLADELDKARGLWNSQTTRAPITTNDVIVAEPTLDRSASTDADDSDSSHPGLDAADAKGEDSTTRQPEKMDVEKESPTSKEPLPLDPGEDLLKAASILGSLMSENPLLQGLTDCLVDERSAEEEILLSGGFQSLSFGYNYPTSNTNPSTTAQSNMVASDDDTEMLRMLDRLVLYLRVVHSVDFYAPAIYPNEDAMPHPCQIIHVRPSKTDLTKALSRTICANAAIAPALDKVFVAQLYRCIRLIRPLNEADCKRLGLRDIEEVVENFVKANTRRKKRKTDVIWVCLLSDKKFRDPIYVRKHIMNKHMEKVEAVKKDNAIFFNNYLLDPMRPQLPLEPHISARRRRSTSRTETGTRETETKETTHEASRERSASDHMGTQWVGMQHGREGYNRPYYPPYQPRRYFSYGSGFNNRPYGRASYIPPRFPFPNQRGRNYPFPPGYDQARRGFPRRPYVDLDAP